MSAISGSLMDTGMGNLLEFLIGALIGSVVLAICAALVLTAARALQYVPQVTLSVFAGAFVTLIVLSTTSISKILRTVMDPGAWALPFPIPHGLSAAALFAIVIAVSTISGTAALIPGGLYHKMSRRARRTLISVSLSTVAISVAVIVSLANDGKDPFETSFTTLSGERLHAATLEDPSLPGDFAVQFLTYGFGVNRRRPEFGELRDLESRSVNAAPLLEEWTDLKQKMRERYWGFGLTDAPLNGRIWTPDAAGQYPLVLIAHGNHGMEDYSDPGYSYLGELLASRGFIVVSVDQNYINASWSGDFLGKEMPLRAWLLLEHLKQWQEWNLSEGHRFFGMVDMENIALIGHSRGGEAVSIAYAYNSLPFYPDDSTIAFDYGFAIRSLVAIAQVDQRYQRRVKLDNVNFLTLHGSYDSDEPAYHGMRQFNRIRLDDEMYRIKAGIYIHRANHGQFNSTWGREDAGPPDSWLLNLAPIIPAEDQQQIAKAYISAFLETTLHKDLQFVDFLADPRAGASWLPNHAYVQQFTDSTFAAIATFDEDLDVTTGSHDGAVIRTDDLLVWREQELMHRDERRQGTNVVVIGWQAGEGAAPVYTIQLGDDFAAQQINAANLLSFSVSGSTETLPEDDGSDEDSLQDADVEPVSPDFTIDLEDDAGSVASVVASDFMTIAPPLRVQYLKPRQLNDRQYNAIWEPVLQTINVPLVAFTDANPALRLTAARILRLRFDRNEDGIIILDDIGIRREPGRPANIEQDGTAPLLNGDSPLF